MLKEIKKEKIDATTTISYGRGETARRRKHLKIKACFFENLT